MMGFPFTVFGTTTGRAAMLSMLLLGSPLSGHAASFQTFLDDEAGFMAALGADAKLVATEDFSSATNDALVAAETAAPDVWNGFTARVIGSGQSPWGASKYCLDLSTCVSWNSSTPAVPGIYGGFNTPAVGISIVPTLDHIVGFSFDFIDWNDGSLRSEFVIVASDGTSIPVSGPVNPGSAPPQTFGIALSAADIKAGITIEEIRWVGTASGSEIVGFYDFRTYTAHEVDSVKAVPVLPFWALVVLSGFVLHAAGRRIAPRRAGI